jgi:hypothetical protein
MTRRGPATITAGHRVVGVDESASMLAHLRLAVPVDALDAVLWSVGLHLDRTLTPDGAWVSAAR